MKIVHLIAGAGQMYCGSCIHGNTLTNALRQAGQDVLLAPLYTPLRVDEPTESRRQVAFGALNVYLQQHSGVFRRMPRVVGRLLDSPGLLRWVGRRAGSTRPESLGPLTVSMLQGEGGRQRRELDKLIKWLQGNVRAELVRLSTVMLVGMAGEIGRRLDVPVVCTLNGEQAFLERLPEPHYSRARALLRTRCGDLAAMVAMNAYTADLMAEYLSAPRDKIHVIPPGLDLTGHREPGANEKFHDGTFTIGYLSRICAEKGLDQLAEAFCLLAADDQCPPIRLVAAGYLASGDRPYLKRIRRRLRQQGLADRFQYLGEPDRAAKIEFLQSLDVMSLPSVQHESKGLAVLEAWANGVPTVLPSHGAFPEMVADTGGGLLYDSNNPAALAETLKRILADRAMAAELGRRAQEAVHQRYNASLMARRTIQLYGSLVGEE